MFKGQREGQEEIEERKTSNSEMLKTYSREDIVDRKPLRSPGNPWSLQTRPKPLLQRVMRIEYVNRSNAKLSKQVQEMM